VLRVPPPKKQKKVAVIGGGPGGMQAARTAAERGHRVILWEREKHLGGMLNAASANNLKTDLKSYLDWAVRQTESNPNITLKLGVRATAELVKKEKPDAVIVAVGAIPWIPPIPGIDGPNCVWAGDVETGKVKTGEKIIVAGGGLTGLEAAISLRKDGKEVTVVEMLPFDSIIMSGPVVNMVTLSMLMREHGVKYMAETTVKEISPDGVLVEEKNGGEKLLACDTVIHALGMRPDKQESAVFTGVAEDVYYAGDCIIDRGNLWSATTSAHYIALEL